MRLARRITALVMVLSLVGGRAFGESSDTEKQARRAFERAEGHFKAGLYGEALSEYQEGYDQMPLPGFLINIAQCQRRLGDLARARATYRKFIFVAPDSPYVPEVKSLIAELDNLLEGATGTEPPPQTDQVNDVPGAATSPSAARVLTPVPPSANALVTVPASAPPPASHRRWWLWGGVAGAVVVGTVAAILLLRSPGTTTIHDGSLGTLRR